MGVPHRRLASGGRLHREASAEPNLLTIFLRRPPMFTKVQSRGFVVLSLGLVSIGNPLHGQSVTPADTPSQDNKIELSYHVKAIKRDSAAQYTMSGTVNGELQGRAILVFGFDEGSSGEAGKALIHSSW